MINAHPGVFLGLETGILRGNSDLAHLANKTGLEMATLQGLYRQTHCLGAFAETVFQRCAETEGKPRWGDKTPGNVLALENIFDWFPEARFVHIIRDGRDVACSLRQWPPVMVKRAPIDADILVPWEKTISTWVSHITAGLAWRGDPRYHEIRYEALIEDAESVMRGVISFLGEEWSPAVVDTDAYRRIWSHPDVGGQIHDKARQRWRNDLPTEARHLFRGKAQDLLERLGYSEDDSWIETAAAAPSAG